MEKELSSEPLLMLSAAHKAQCIETDCLSRNGEPYRAARVRPTDPGCRVGRLSDEEHLFALAEDLGLSLRNYTVIHNCLQLQPQENLVSSSDLCRR